MAGAVIVVSMVVATEDEAAARAIMAEIAAAAGVECAFLSWRPYPKLGPHSKLGAAVRLPFAPAGQDLIDACEDFASVIVAEEGLAKGVVSSFLEHDGILFYNRIFDARTAAFRREDVLWLDIEAHTHPDRLGELAALFTA